MAPGTFDMWGVRLLPTPAIVAFAWWYLIQPRWQTKAIHLKHSFSVEASSFLGHSTHENFELFFKSFHFYGTELCLACNTLKIIVVAFLTYVWWICEAWLRKILLARVFKATVKSRNCDHFIFSASGSLQYYLVVTSRAFYQLWTSSILCTKKVLLNTYDYQFLFYILYILYLYPVLILGCNPPRGSVRTWKHFQAVFSVDPLLEVRLTFLVGSFFFSSLSLS